MGRRPTLTGGSRALERLTDEELVHAMSSPDPRAFEVLYQRHATVAYSLAYRIMGTPAAAEDVTQDAFLSAWRASGTYERARGSVRTWLLGIVHHRAVDALRRRNPRERREVEGEAIIERMASPQRTDEEVAERQEAASVRTLLAELPAEQQRVIELAYYGGLTHTEIAELLDAPLGTIKSRMRLALEKLRAVAPTPESRR